MLNEKNCPVGTILIDEEGDDVKVLATSSLAFLMSYVDNFPLANDWRTWEEAERAGLKIKKEQVEPVAPVERTVEEINLAACYIALIEHEYMLNENGKLRVVGATLDGKGEMIKDANIKK